jgi:FMN phosphatase YigB (HAD superfamily)
MVDVLQNYKKKYQLKKYVSTFDNGKIFYDCVDNPVISSQLVFIFDIDYTLIDTSKIKPIFDKTFGQFHPSLAPNQWSQTYIKAKVRENYYDTSVHIDLLSQILEEGGFDGNAKEELITIFTKTLWDAIPLLVYPQIINFIRSLGKKATIIFATSADLWYQRNKVNALLQSTDLEPQAIAYIQNVPKGVVMHDILRKFKLSNQKTYVFDDNVDELENIDQYFLYPNLNLIRIMQLNGNYNSKVTTNPHITTIDLRNDSKESELNTQSLGI